MSQSTNRAPNPSGSALESTIRTRLDDPRREFDTRLRAIFDGTYTFIGLLSPDGTLLEANRASLEWIGCQERDVIGRRFWETPWWTRTPGASEVARAAVEQAARGEFVRMEVTLDNAQGRSIFDFSLHPILDEHGKVTFLVPEGRDITDRIRDAQEIERRYRDGLRITEINRKLVGSFDFDAVADTICKAARELTGADGATLVLRQGERVRYAAEDATEPLWKGSEFPIEACISGWAMLHSEVAVIEDIYADERVPHAAYRSTFVKSLLMTPVGPGTPVASIGVYWARKHLASSYEVALLQSLASGADLALAGVRAYEDARRASVVADSANRAKDEFLATLSHELRNPLNSIVGFAELLLRTPEALHLPVVRQAADVIQRNAKLQSRLISDLLDLSRLQTGKLTLERQPSNLVALVGEAVETIRAQAVEKGVALELELPRTALRVLADEGRIRQIVWNLVDNGLKFTGAGGSVRVRLSEENGAAVLRVEDTGQGIEPQFLPHVFEMFRQADARTTRTHGGLGVGLALVHQLVELHGGSVEARSDGSARGAAFSVRLPLYADPSGSAHGDADPSAGELAGVSILIVDDTEDSLEMLRLLLETQGAVVAAAASGEAALATARAGRFHAVISDISMPLMDGYEFVRELRTLPGYAEMPVIALTGFGRKEDQERCRDAGFSTHLTKPVEFEKLIGLMKRSVGR